VPSSRRIRDRRVHAARRLARGFGALLLGYYDQDGKLIYAGRVGTGFNHRTLAELRARLEPLRQAESPFARKKGGPTRKSLWVRPELVAQVKFTQWTQDGSVRHPSFQGLREDKPARAVGREKTVPVRKTARKARTQG
jgi:bifunctional non-homologous end joining protein LigD